MRCKSDDSLGSYGVLFSLCVYVCILCVRIVALVVMCLCAPNSCSMVSIYAPIVMRVQLSGRNTVVGKRALCNGGRERNYLRSQDNVFG